MADEEAVEPVPDGGKSKLMLVLVVTNLLVVAGAGAAVFFAMSQPTQEASAEEVEEPDTLGPLVEIASMVVNLSDEGTRFLRISLQVETPSEEAKVEVEARLVPIRSALLLYLSGLSAADFTGTEARQAILEECQARIAEQAGEARVRRVYIGDMVVQ